MVMVVIVYSEQKCRNNEQDTSFESRIGQHMDPFVWCAFRTFFHLARLACSGNRMADGIWSDILYLWNVPHVPRQHYLSLGASWLRQAGIAQARPY